MVPGRVAAGVRNLTGEMVRMMEENLVYEKLSEIFHSVFEDDFVLSPQLSADDVDGWDSLTHLRLMISVQKAFGVKFSAAEVSELDNVGDLVKLIRAKR